jgi:hypothetical protein
MLTRAEKLAGRWFRQQMHEHLAVVNAADPPSVSVPWVLRHVRHNCASRDGLSVSFEAREVYVLSPEIWVCYCSAAGLLGDSFPHDDCQGGVVAAAEGRFAYIYKEGRCTCGVTGRSPSGHVADAYERLPIGGKATPWQTMVTGARSPASGRTLSR